MISATGGGHYAAAQAIAAGLERLFPGKFDFLFVDAFREYFGFPLRKAPEIYARWVALSPRSYGLAFSITDIFYRSSISLDSFQSYYGRRMMAKAAALRPDIVLPIHALLVRPAAEGRESLGGGFLLATVVTDFARPHRGWFHPSLELCLVPGDTAAARAREVGIQTERITRIGLLVHPRFGETSMGVGEARERLGLDHASPTVLLVGGGEGMGTLPRVADELDRKLSGAQLLIVCGWNRALREKLERRRWRNRVRIYGFVHGMELLLRAADILVTKAGPLSIAEGLTLGLPILLYDAIPKQETANAIWVERVGAGRFIPDPAKLAHTAMSWLSEPEVLSRFAARAREAAVPDSALRAAVAIGGLLGLPAPQEGPGWDS